MRDFLKMYGRCLFNWAERRTRDVFFRDYGVSLEGNFGRLNVFFTKRYRTSSPDTRVPYGNSENAGSTTRRYENQFYMS